MVSPTLGRRVQPGASASLSERAAQRDTPPPADSDYSERSGAGNPTPQGADGGGPPALAFWSAAFSICLIYLGFPGLRGSEDRFAEIAREMLLTGDVLHPTLNGEAHFHKPLASYWGILLASLPLGQVDEWSARLPSALAGLAALAAVVSIGRRALGEREARLAGWLLLTSYGFVFWARTSSADMAQMAAIALAVAWFVAHESRPGFLLYMGFYALCVAGAHSKGLAAIVVPVLVMLPRVLRAGSWRQHLCRGHALALGIAGLAYLLPFGLAELAREEPFAPVDAILAADRQSGLYMVLRENVERFLAPFDHRGPIYTYLTAVPVLVAPWTVLFLAAAASLAAAWRRATPDARWILEANAIVLVLFSLSGSRRSYYILPILPFCALLTAIRFAEVGHDGLSRLVLRITMVVLVAAASLAAAAAVAAPLVQQVSGLPFPLELRLFALVVGLCALLPWLAGRPTRAHVADALGVDRDVVAHLLSATLLIGSYFCVAQPILDRYRTEKPFALALREEVQDLPPERIAFLTHAPAFFPFYLGLSRPARVLSSSDELGRFVRSGEGVVILSRKKVAALEGALPAELAVEPLLAEPIQPWERRTGKKWLAWRVGRDR